MIRALIPALRLLFVGLVTSSALLSAAGCGQKGPLKLPDPPPAKPASSTP